MSRLLAAILLAFVVFACGDPINVEKRFLPIGPNVPSLDLLGQVDGLATDVFLKSLAELIKSIRKTLEGLNVCPHKKGDHGDHGHYEPGYEDGHDRGNQDDYRSGYVPSYRPIYRVARDSEVSKVDLACEILKPLIEFLVKLLRQLEKTLGCMQGKEKGYKGDYKDCK